MKATIDLDWEAADKIALLVLDDLHESLDINLLQGAPVFVKNKTRDKQIIKQHIEAIKLIKKYLEPK